jgi:hypothetical protein
MDYLACNLPTGPAKDPEDYWSEYLDGKTPEARLAQEICPFEHLISLDEDGITIGDLYQSNISSPELRRWMGFLDSSKEEMKDLQNTASFGSSYWKDPDKTCASWTGLSKPNCRHLLFHTYECSGIYQLSNVRAGSSAVWTSRMYTRQMGKVMLATHGESP